MSVDGRLSTLENRSAGDGMPRLMLVQLADGTYTHRGSGQTYTAQEAADLDARGAAVLLSFRVVHAAECA